MNAYQLIPTASANAGDTADLVQAILVTRHNRHFFIATMTIPPPGADQDPVTEQILIQLGLVVTAIAGVMPFSSHTNAWVQVEINSSYGAAVML